MATQDLTEENFNETIHSNDIVLVDWWATWCGPCRMFAPVFEEVSNAHPEIVFAKVDTEANQALAASAEIMSIPTLMAFREKVLVYSQAGALPKEALEDLIRQVHALDMQKVHEQVAKQASERHSEK